MKWRPGVGGGANLSHLLSLDRRRRSVCKQVSFRVKVHRPGLKDMRAAARVAALERRRRAAGTDDIEIRVVHWRDEGEQGEPVASSMGRRVDYRAGLHWLAPVEHQPPAERVIVLSWGE